MRNHDPDQIFYPEDNEDEGDPETPCLGPDDLSEGRCWLIRDMQDLFVRIEFSRIFTPNGEELKTSWGLVEGMDQVLRLADKMVLKRPG